MNDSYAATLHHSHSSNQKPYVALDGLRGVASLMVIVRMTQWGEE